jgi:eukaryotic-like serine/threonine-protein kinase
MSHDLKLLSDLLDEALDLDELACEEFLRKIQQTQPALALQVREMLHLRATLETDELLTQKGRRFNARSMLAAIQGGSRNEHAALQGSFSSALTPRTMIGPYRLMRCLGEGGMASVWLAERNDETLKRTVALKLLHAWRHTHEVVERFARERDILAQLTHPNIARLYDAGVTESGLPWIALEHVDGTHITAYADKHRLTIRSRISLMLQVMEAVQYAHQNFVVHRDIKPGNILIDASGNAHLLDFGIAKLVRAEDEGIASAMETALTEASGRTLTLRYAAPEQIEGGAITAATDVYAIGLVTAELLTGAHPRNFSNNKIPAQAVLDAAITRPSRADINAEAAEARQASIAQLQSELRGDLDTIVIKSLARDPAQRYATVNAFADDLNAWLERRPIRARAPSLAYRAKLFLSRNRWPAAMVATVVLVASFAGFQSWKSAQAIAEQRARTERLQLFMGNLLGEAEPSGLPNEGVITAKALLDRGRERAYRDYADQPGLRGEILGELARVYLRIGESKMGTSLLEESIGLLERHMPADEPQLHLARAQLGSLLLSGGERGKAVALLESVLKDCTRVGVACDGAKGDAHLYLAHDTGLGAARTRAHIDAALALFRKSRGAESEGVMQTLLTAADLERWQGNLAGAKERLQQAEALAPKLAIKGKVYIRLQNTRAGVFFEEGKYALAAETLDSLIADGMAPDRSGTRGSIFAFRARIANVQGQPVVALRHVALARESVNRALASRLYAQIELQHAVAESLTSNHELAIKLVNDAKATLHSAGIAEIADVSLLQMRIAGEVYARQGDIRGARRQLVTTLELLRTNPPSDVQHLIHTIDRLGAVSMASGHAIEAIALHKEELDILSKRVNGEHPLYLRAALQYARAQQVAQVSVATNIEEMTRAFATFLPEDSTFRPSLSALAAGTLKSDEALLLF